MARHERTVAVRNRLGMHARAAVKFVQATRPFGADIVVRKGDTEVNGRSIMGLLTLVAALGTPLTVIAEGDDAEAAVAALAMLIDGGFGEGVDTSDA